MTLTTSRLIFLTVLISLLGPGWPTSSRVSAANAQEAAGTAPSLTPGALVLLSGTFDAPAVERVRAAIAADDPVLRAVSARLAGAMGDAALTGAIWSALGRELDPVVAGEQARTLLFLQGAAAGGQLENELDRSPHIAIVYAEWLARMQPGRLADLLPALAAKVPGHRTALNPHILAASERLPDASERLLRAWLAVTTPVAWRTLLEHPAMDSPRPDRDAAMIAALDSPDSDIRDVTVWNLVGRLARSRAVASPVLAAAVAALPETDADARGAPTWEQFGREMLARRHTNRRTPDRAALLKAEAAQHHRDGRSLAAMEQLTEPERKALKEALGDRYPKNPAAIRDSVPTVRDGNAMRTLPTLWPRLLGGVIDAAGCQPPGDRGSLPGLVSVAYRPDGRVGRISVNPGLSAPCEQAMIALARLALADAAYPSPVTTPEWLVLPLDKEYVECTNSVGPGTLDTPDRVDDADSIKPPVKTRDVRPVYPVTLQQRGVAGRVIVEGVIATNGCIPTIRVMQGADAALDLAALQAVSAWRFRPTTINGRAVPALMTVTVNFSLR